MRWCIRTRNRHKRRSVGSCSLRFPVLPCAHLGFPSVRCGGFDAGEEPADPGPSEYVPEGDDGGADDDAGQCAHDRARGLSVIVVGGVLEVAVLVFDETEGGVVGLPVW